MTKFLNTFLTLSRLSLYMFLHIPSLFFLDIYQDILRGRKRWWVKYGANDPSELDSTSSWRPSLACGQLRLPDPKWSEIPTQFLDVHLIETYFYLIKSAKCILDLSSRMWICLFFVINMTIDSTRGLTEEFHHKLHIQGNHTKCHQKQFPELRF